MRLIVVAVGRFVIEKWGLEKVPSIAGPRVLALPRQGATLSLLRLLLWLPLLFLVAPGGSMVSKRSGRRRNGRRARRRRRPYHLCDMSAVARSTPIVAQPGPRRLLLFRSGLSGVGGARRVGKL